MTPAPCDRPERELLSRMEAGEGPDAHELECEHCQAERARYERLGEAFGDLPPIPAPAGWEDRVLAAIPASPQRRSGPTWPYWAFGLAAAAALAIVVWRSGRPETEARRLAVRQDVVAMASGRRADSAVIGDTLRVSAAGGDGAVRELRLYRDNKAVVARCPGSDGCVRRDDSLELTVVLATPGTYRSLVIVGARAAPEPTGSLDGDAQAAAAAGSTVEVSRAVEAE